EHLAAPYLQYDLWVGGLTEQGLAQVPTDSGAVVCGLHAPCATKVVQFFAVRRFKAPTLTHNHTVRASRAETSVRARKVAVPRATPKMIQWAADQRSPRGR